MRGMSPQNDGENGALPLMLVVTRVSFKLPEPKKISVDLHRPRSVHGTCFHVIVPGMSRDHPLGLNLLSKFHVENIPDLRRCASRIMYILCLFS